jgi:putative phosphoesterase
MTAEQIIRLGLISDTHGLLRPQAVESLRGCDALLHAGDVGSAQVLDSLRSVAPITAVRGNNDTDPWARDLAEALTIELHGVRIHLLHDVKMLAVDPVAEGLNVVVSGHSHCPMIERRAGVLYFNPGSAGPRRFKLPVAIGILEISRGKLDGRIVELSV